jgi:hypothetical protein
MMRAFTADAGVSLTLTSAGMIYPGYRGPLVMAQNSRNDHFPLVANG